MNKYKAKNKIYYSIINNSKKWSRRLKKVSKIIKRILENQKYFINDKCKYYNITFLLTDNKRIKKLNKTYRNKQKPTDVLTFTSFQKINNHEIIRFCDIVISATIIKYDAEKLKINFYAHLTHIIIHALLHSNQHKHNTEKNYKKMKSLEISILKKLNIKNPYN